jgi:hypothetical protein
MNKILHLLNEEYVKEYLSRKMLQFYPEIVSIKEVSIIPHKKMIWDKTYHVVLEYETTFLLKNKKIKKLNIFCSAHSHESRLDFYLALKFLWQHGFGKGNLSLPHPLFFSRGYNALFYRGVMGRNLYYYIKKNDTNTIEKIIPKAAKWFAKLHKLKIEGKFNFNEKNSHIATIIPGKQIVLDKINEMYPDIYLTFSKIYDIIEKNENIFFASTNKRWLIHGDAHPENIIIMSHRKIAAIDFSDFCAGDFARDLGSFIQQVGYMINRKIGRTDYAKKIQKLFLDSYLKSAKIKIDRNLRERIDNYYYLTALRTATYFFIKDNPDPSRAEPLINEIVDNL